MRKTLVINSGSSSLKYKLYTMPNFEVDCEGIVDRIGISGSIVECSFAGKKIEDESPLNNHEEAIAKLLEILTENNLIDNKDEITRVGHRIVQGGEMFKEATVIDDSNIEKVYDLAKLAPLHNKANADGIKIFQKLLPKATNVAVFDTVFHQTMPPESYLYAVPYSWYKDYDVRKYGMHGTSHKYVSAKLGELMNVDVKSLKIISCHLGNGASLCAVKNGECLQTSMGLTPLAGIAMGTRSGDIDPSILEYMNSQTGKNISELTNILNKESGILGLSGLSSDFRDLTAAIQEGNERAIQTLDVYVTRIIETIGAYAVRLGGLDAITFTAGVGENSVFLRKMILERLSIFKIEVDDATNENRKLGDRKITSENSNVESWVISTDEEFQIALEAERF